MTALNTRKMMPESAFLFMAMEEWTLQTHRQQASKVFIKEKQIAPRTAGMGEKSPCSLLSYRGFYPLKMGGGTNVGSRKMWLSPISLTQLPVSVPVQ